MYGKPAQSAYELKTLWRARRTSNAPLDQSGVWRDREFIPFLDDLSRVVTLREGCTPLLPGPRAAPSTRSGTPRSSEEPLLVVTGVKMVPDWLGL